MSNRSGKQSKFTDDADIPKYLQSFITKQDPSLYTPMDHANWRYIMRLSREFFTDHAHEKYLRGLEETGISSERIPLISEMDECLKRFGWRAIGVVGFIPPAAFMEFLSLRVLPIACDMRSAEHLSYTPAPDIVHEAAGHAPILADPEYVRFLTLYGEIAPKAIYTKQDEEVYMAIRELSDIKEDPKSKPIDIQTAQKRLEVETKHSDYISEAALLARMGWWTFEYGLIGTMDDPKIYGAGLLSSLSESYHCLGPDVKKIPFSIDCIQTSYDITRPQPQLFVTPNFPTLTKVLEEFAATLAYKKGGAAGLQKALRADATTTAVLNSGVQVSGHLTEVLYDDFHDPCFLKYKGGCQLSYKDEELEGHGVKYHAEGYSTPIGMLKDFRKLISDLQESDFKVLGVEEGKRVKLEFQSGFVVEGMLKNILKKDGKNLVMAFEDCTVKRGDEVFFKPDWGTFDLACGTKVTSAFGGAADRSKYMDAQGGFKQKPALQKTNMTDKNQKLNLLYGRLREIREQKPANLVKIARGISDELEKNYPREWLLRIELLELDVKHHLGHDIIATIESRLKEIAEDSDDVAEMIRRGRENLPIALFPVKAPDPNVLKKGKNQ